MRIDRVEYAGTVAQEGQAPPGDLPQIAFSGRSNVGKSSLINTLLRRTRKKIAHVSSTPGKTQALNFYRVEDRFFLGSGTSQASAVVSGGVALTMAATTKLLQTNVDNEQNRKLVSEFVAGAGEGGQS